MVVSQRMAGYSGVDILPILASYLNQGFCSVTARSNGMDVLVRCGALGSPGCLPYIGPLGSPGCLNAYGTLPTTGCLSFIGSLVPTG